MKQLFFYLLALFIVVGCQKKEENSTFRMSFHSDPVTLDPRKSGDFISCSVIFMLYQGLTELRADGTISLAIASSYTLSPDKKTYTFYLRDAKWTNGVKVTAYDFVSSWKKVLDPKFPSLCKQLFYCIKNAKAIINKELPPESLGVYALSENILQVDLDHPIPYFLTLTSSCAYFPIFQNSEDLIGKVTNGPFSLASWKPNDEIILKKSCSFWMEKEVFLENIKIAIIPDENTALNLYKQNELDFIGTPLSPLPIDALASLKSSKEFHSFLIGGTTFLAFNLEKFPLNNPNIRKALSLAINRDAIVKHITQLDEPIASRLIPPLLMQGKNRSLIEDNNPTLARAFLKKGLKELQKEQNEIRITLTYSHHTLQRKLAEAIKEEIENALGIVVILAREEEKIWIEKLHTHQFELALASWIVHYPDPMNIFERFMFKNGPKNYPGFENEEYKNLLESSFFANNANERNVILEKSEEIFIEELPLSPIYHHNYSLLLKPYVENMEIGPAGDIHCEHIILRK